MWHCALQLNPKREVIAGSEAALADAIRRGQDLRIYTEFIHNEHVDVTSDNPERIQEVAEFGVTYLLQDSWVAGFMSLRQPVSLPAEFGPRPSMSFFLYNQNAQQAIARPYLDGRPTPDQRGASPLDAPAGMAKYHALDNWDAQTNAPSGNFIYDFETYRFCVSDSWQEVFANDENGATESGSLQALTDAFAQGREVKAGVRDLCADMSQPKGTPSLSHEVFVQMGSCYYYTGQKCFIAGSHPVVRVRPRIPLRYESEGWDFGWLLLRTDGRVLYRRCDPYTLKFSDLPMRRPLRWFVR